jgi:uncharacterized protein
VAYHIYRDTTNLWRWYLLAGNNRKIANSGESYYNKADCIAAITLVKSSGSAPVYED